MALVKASMGVSVALAKTAPPKVRRVSPMVSAASIQVKWSSPARGVQRSFFSAGSASHAASWGACQRMAERVAPRAEGSGGVTAS